MYEVVLLIISIGLVLSLGYTLIYYKRMNGILHDSNKRLFKISPKTFSLFILFGMVLSSNASSMSNVMVLESKVEELEEYIATDQYQKEEFLSEEFEYIYTYYNPYFGGNYAEDSEIIICIKENAPQDLLDYLSENSINYVLVKFSYSDLLQLHEMLVNLDLSDIGSHTIANDLKTNKVILFTQEVELLSDRFNSYIEDGILEVRYGGIINYQ